ncbi:MAG: FCD domain-containing protein [Planctomycetes bacterium]|nr:FCD domain-containing protein [Planctomycetota bacterium]
MLAQNLDIAARRVCLYACAAHLKSIRRHIEAQEALVREGGAREFATMDREFHDLINAACDNELLRDYLRQLELQHQQARSLALAQDQREDAATAWAQESIAPHQRML